MLQQWNSRRRPYPEQSTAKPNIDQQGSTLSFLAGCPKSHSLADTEISLYIDI